MDIRKKAISGLTLISMEWYIVIEGAGKKSVLTAIIITKEWSDIPEKHREGCSPLSIPILSTASHLL